MFSSSRILLLLIIFTVPGSVTAGEARDLVEKLRAELETLRADLVREDTPDRRREIARKAHDLVLEHLDLDEVIRLSLGANYAKLTPAQKKEFESILRDLLGSQLVESQIPSGAELAKPVHVELTTEETVQDTVFDRQAIALRALIPHEKITYELELRFLRKGDRLLLYDVLVDGASVLLDFKNQFHRQISEKGLPALLKKLRARLKEVRKR